MAPSDARSPEQIEADLAAVRNRLSGSIQVLIDQVHPNRVKQRTIARIRAKLQAKVDQAKALVVEPDGRLRTERLAFASLFATEDQKEGMAAFREKRAAAFRGR